MRYGEQYKYGLYLEKAYEKGVAEELLKKSRQIIKFSDYELIELIEHYNKLLTNLK
tara:strand:- start:359 stop:526 length:168 start_codon:yes stop_codon:yes gene_type:complete